MSFVLTFLTKLYMLIQFVQDFEYSKTPHTTLDECGLISLNTWMNVDENG